MEVGCDLRALLDDERRGARLDARDAARILRGEARDGCRSEHTLRSKSEQVGLNAGARSAVGSGDAEGDGKFAARGGGVHSSSAGQADYIDR